MSSSWRWREKDGMRRIFLELGLGQLVSLCLAMMSFTASLVAIEVDSPLTLSFSTYLSLAVVYGSVLLYRRHKMLVPWYWYVLLAFVDVHGNYFGIPIHINYECDDTGLLDDSVVDHSYTDFPEHEIFQVAVFGAAVCVAGLGLVLLSDVRVGGGGGGDSNPLLGDFLVIAGTLFFAMSNVGEEFCVKKKDLTEVIAMIGLFGMLISASEIPVLEGKALKSINWSAGLMSAFAAYAVSGFLFYTLAPFVLKISGATLFNLSLLTSDIWAVAVRTFIYKQNVDWLYYPAFVLVVAGVFIYSKTEKDGDDSSLVLADASLSPEYCLIDEENSSHVVTN